MKMSILLLIEYIVTTALWWWRCLMDGGVPDPIWVFKAIAIGIMTAVTTATLLVLIKRGLA
jgi:hypothetical protein